MPISTTLRALTGLSVMRLPVHNNTYMETLDKPSTPKPDEPMENMISGNGKKREKRKHESYRFMEWWKRQRLRASQSRPRRTSSAEPSDNDARQEHEQLPHDKQSTFGCTIRSHWHPNRESRLNTCNLRGKIQERVD
jgi:hypothetical protein